jgi:hypothetical protein
MKEREVVTTSDSIRHSPVFFSIRRVVSCHDAVSDAGDGEQ